LDKVSGILCDQQKTDEFFKKALCEQELFDKVLAFVPEGATLLTKATSCLDERTLDCLFASTRLDPCEDYTLLKNIEVIRPDIKILNVELYMGRIFRDYPSYNLGYLVSNCESIPQKFQFHDAVEDCRALKALLGVISEVLYSEDMDL
jgi:hypothetical protein